MKRIIPLLVLIQLINFFSCKKKVDVSSFPKIGEFYIYKSDVPIYESPDRGKVIDRVKLGEKVEIVETNIPDKVKGFWYKSIHGENVGYIPLQEETNKNLVAFIYRKERGRITASSLRIRETPDLKGKVLGAVPKGTLVDILSQGLVYEKIDDKYDTWMKIHTDEGITGYSYAGYISKNLDPESDEVDAEPINGYVEINEDPNYLVRPGGREVKDSDPAPCGYNMIGSLPQKGIIHKIEYKYIEDGTTYYKIEGGDDSHGCYESYRAWISEKQVLFVEDIYKYTLEHYGAKFDKAFLDVINENVNGQLNVKTLNIEPSTFKVKEPGYTFYTVHNAHMYYKYNGSYYYAGEGWGEYVDVDGDGTNEIISAGDCACMCSEARVIIWNGNKLEKIFEEYPQASLRWEVGKNFLTAIRSEDFSENSNGQETYYEIKNNQLLPLKKKPQI